MADRHDAFGELARRAGDVEYAITLQKAVIEKITRWQISADVMRELFRGLDRLAASPASSLVRIGPPEDTMQYDLVIHDPGPPLRDYLFVFHVKYAADEEGLIVLDCGYIFEEHSP